MKRLQKDLWAIRFQLNDKKSVESFDTAIKRIEAEQRNDPKAKIDFWVQEKEILNQVRNVYEEAEIGNASVDVVESVLNKLSAVEMNRLIIIKKLIEDGNVIGLSESEIPNIIEKFSISDVNIPPIDYWSTVLKMYPEKGLNYLLNSFDIYISLQELSNLIEWLKNPQPTGLYFYGENKEGLPVAGRLLECLYENPNHYFNFFVDSFLYLKDKFNIKNLFLEQSARKNKTDESMQEKKEFIREFNLNEINSIIGNGEIPENQFVDILNWIESPTSSVFYFIGKENFFPKQLFSNNISNISSLRQVLLSIKNNKNFNCEHVKFLSEENTTKINKLSHDITKKERSELFTFAQTNKNFKDEWLDDKNKTDLIKLFKSVQNYELAFSVDLHLDPVNFLAKFFKNNNFETKDDLRSVFESYEGELVHNTLRVVIGFYEKKDDIENEKVSENAVLFFRDSSASKIENNELFLESLQRALKKMQYSGYVIRDIDVEPLAFNDKFARSIHNISHVKNSKYLEYWIQNPSVGSFVIVDKLGAEIPNHKYTVGYEDLFLEDFKNYYSTIKVPKDCRLVYEENTNPAESLESLNNFLEVHTGINLNSRKKIATTVFTFLNPRKSGSLNLYEKSDMFDGDFETYQINKNDSSYTQKILRMIQESELNEIRDIEFIETPDDDLPQKKLNAPESPDQS